MITEAIVLAGGLGTRLRQVVNDVPKSMAPVNGIPFLEYQLNYLEQQGIRRVVLSVGYKSDCIVSHFGSRYHSIALAYAREQEPLGTGGGIRLAMEQIQGSTAFVLNGDTMFRVNLSQMELFHQQKNTPLSICLRQVEQVKRYGKVELDEQQRILNFAEKGVFEGNGLINGGIYLLEKTFFSRFQLPARFSIEKSCFEAGCRQTAFYGFISDDYFLDIGIPQDYERAQIEFKQFIG